MRILQSERSMNFTHGCLVSRVYLLASYIVIVFSSRKDPEVFCIDSYMVTVPAHVALLVLYYDTDVSELIDMFFGCYCLLYIDSS